MQIPTAVMSLVYGAPLTLDTSASPAGLTAGARPEARPQRAANLPPEANGVPLTVVNLHRTEGLGLLASLREAYSSWTISPA